MKRKITTVLIGLMLCFGLQAQKMKWSEIAEYGYWNGSRFNDGLETIAWDETTGRLVYSRSKQVGVVNIDDPLNPSTEGFISPGFSVTCVAAYNGVVAMCGTNKDTNYVEFWDIATRAKISEVNVGVWPDNIQFSKDGMYAITVNEADFEEYDGEKKASISIIDLSGGIASINNAAVTTLGFDQFFDQGYSKQTFDSTALSTWNYTTSPAQYITYGQGSCNSCVNSAFYTDIHGQDVLYRKVRNGWYGIGNEFFVVKNIQNSGISSAQTIDFDALPTNGVKSEISFNLSMFYLEQGLDSVGYILEYNNGTTWNMANYVELADSFKINHNGDYEDILNYSIPINGAIHSDVRIRFYFKYAGVDSLKLTTLDEVVFKISPDSLKVPIYIPRENWAQAPYYMEPEYVAISPDSKMAMVTLQENNGLVKVNLVTKQIEAIYPAGYVDNSIPGYEVQFAKTYKGDFLSYPFQSIKMPDGISAFDHNGQTYFISVNEGEDGGFINRGDIGDVLDDFPELIGFDTAAFGGNLEPLFNDDKAGDYNRFLLDSDLMDTNGDSLVDRLIPIGGRNFTIYDIAGTIVHEGELFDKIYPNTNDQRQLGQEPEGVTVGEINGKRYAFMALERAGGMVVYDITDPFNPFFVQKVQTGARPEYVLFIPAAKSPNGKDLVMVSNEDDDMGLSILGMVEDREIEVVNNDLSGITDLEKIPGTEDEYYAITGRGPIFYQDNDISKFLNPSFAPSIYRISYSEDSITILDTIVIKMAGQAFSGIPSMVPGTYSYTGETPIDSTTGDTLSGYSNGLFPGGIATDGVGNLFVGDKYGSRILKLNEETGEVIKIYSPYGANPELDTIYKYSRRLAGLGALDIDLCTGKLLATTEMPIDKHISSNLNPTKSRTKAYRLLEMDITTEEINYWGIYSDDRYRYYGLKIINDNKIAILSGYHNDPEEDRVQLFIYERPENGEPMDSVERINWEKQGNSLRNESFVWAGGAQYGEDYLAFQPYSDFEGFEYKSPDQMIMVNFNNFGIKQLKVTLTADAQQIAENNPTIFKGIQFSTNLLDGYRNCQQDSLAVVSNSDWTKSTVTTQANAGGYPWQGVAGVLPADSTFSLVAEEGQPRNWHSIDNVDGSSVLKTDAYVTYFRKDFNLSVDTNIAARFRVTADDDIEIYLNGNLVAREGDKRPENAKNAPHDIVFHVNGTVENGYNGGDAFNYFTSQKMEEYLVAGNNTITVAIRNGKNNDKGGFSFRMDLESGVATTPVQTDSIVSDNLWKLSTVSTNATSQQFPWMGVASLPADNTFSIPAAVGQPGSWNSILEVPGSSVLKAEENVTYYRTWFELSDNMDLNTRIRSYFDDNVEVYVNGTLIAREQDMSGMDNFRGNAHDLMLNADGSVANPNAGGDAFDYVATVDMDTVYQAGMNHVTVGLRNRANDKGGFSFRMDLDKAGNAVIVKKNAEASANDDASFAVYPNPTSGVINIALPQATTSEVMIFNISGKLVYAADAQTEVEVDLSAYPAGVYFLKVKNGSKNFTEKLIKY